MLLTSEKIHSARTESSVIFHSFLPFTFLFFPRLWASPLLPFIPQSLPRASVASLVDGVWRLHYSCIEFQMQRFGVAKTVKRGFH